MNSPPLLISCLLSGIAGLTGHLGLFIKGDWDHHAITLINAFVFWPTLICIFLALFASRATLSWTAAIFLSHHGAVCLSIVVYRYFFHALCQYNGPRMARIASFWAFWTIIFRRKWHLKVQDLHRQYGDFVRIKPREISINDPAAVKEIHGIGTKCVKGPFYDLNYPHQSLQFSRDRGYHSKRRRTWDRAFTSQALAGYEPYVLKHCRDLASLISARTEEALEATALIDAFCWDSMGILAFGKSFGMLQGSAPERLRQVKELGGLAVLVLCTSWVGFLFRNIWGLRRETDKWLGWCGEQVEERRK
ncbi:cytochrome P450, partial [Aspergillus leporis]